MLALLTLVKPPAASSERRSGSRHWSSVQQEELQLQALATLATVAPLLLDDYMSCQGNACMLLLLDWCIKQGERDKQQTEERLKRSCPVSETPTFVCTVRMPFSKVSAHSLCSAQML